MYTSLVLFIQKSLRNTHTVCRIAMFFVLCILGLYCVGNYSYAQETEARFDSSFVQRVRQIGIPIETVAQQESLSRYELARILNLVECRDCLDPGPSMVDAYTIDFWNRFTDIPGKDFQDIPYGGGEREGNNYYYCVAYVGDQSYMRGYPNATSPICRGGFCGDRPTTKAEFIQVVVNIAKKYIYPNYSVNRATIQERSDSIRPGSYAERSLTQGDKDIITSGYGDCGNANCGLRSADELGTYMRYCMFNVDACGFSEYGWIRETYWPISELNLLQREQLLPGETNPETNIHDPVSGAYVLQVLGELHKRVGCVYNVDYDCDGVPNREDNCPNTYNPSQSDYSFDGIGDVCSTDIDGDRKTHPIHMVDDAGNINIKALQDPANLDDDIFSNRPTIPTTPTIPEILQTAPQTPQGEGMTIWIDPTQGGDIYTYTMRANIDGQADKISWQFGDGVGSFLSNPQHVFKGPGTYYISTQVSNNFGTAIASSTISLGKIRNAPEGLALNPNTLAGSKPLAVNIAPLYVGDGEEISRRIQEEEIIDTVNTTRTTLFTTDGIQTIRATTQKDGKITAISQFTAEIGTFLQRGSALVPNTLSPQINQDFAIRTRSQGWNINDVASIKRQVGSNVLDVSGPEVTINIATGGSHVILQTITFLDGSTHSNMITVAVPLASIEPVQSLHISLENPVVVIGDQSALTINTKGIDPASIEAITLYLGDGTQRTLSVEDMNTTIFHTYTKKGVFSPHITIQLNNCITFQSQATLRVRDANNCVDILNDQNLRDQYVCDLDKDTIPDICDMDIDGDGIPNELGLILFENPDCSIGPNNINPDFFLKPNPGSNPNQNIQGPTAVSDNQNPSTPPSQNGGTGPNDNDPNTGNPTSRRNNVNPGLLSTHINACGLDNCPFIANNNQTDTLAGGATCADLFLANMSPTRLGEIAQAIEQTRTPQETDDNNQEDIPDTGPQIEPTTIDQLRIGQTFDTLGPNNPFLANRQDTCTDPTICPDLDSDKDGIPDIDDFCPFLPENFNGFQNLDGCPEFFEFDRCFIYPEIPVGFVAVSNCQQCPCHFADIGSQLANGDTVRAILMNKEGTKEYRITAPYSVQFTDEDEIITDE